MKGDLVSNRRDGRNKRYFLSKKFSEMEMRIISVLRHETARKILQILHDDGSASHGKLAKRLEISSQALTWQIKQLKDEGLVSGQVDGATVNYVLEETCSSSVKQCLTVVS
jgi:predicted transcriptional regulator